MTCDTISSANGDTVQHVWVQQLQVPIIALEFAIGIRMAGAIIKELQNLAAQIARSEGSDLLRGPKARSVAVKIKNLFDLSDADAGELFEFAELALGDFANTINDDVDHRVGQAVAGVGSTSAKQQIMLTPLVYMTAADWVKLIPDEPFHVWLGVLTARVQQCGVWAVHEKTRKSFATILVGSRTHG